MNSNEVPIFLTFYQNFEIFFNNFLLLRWRVKLEQESCEDVGSRDKIAAEEGLGLHDRIVPHFLEVSTRVETGQVEVLPGVGGYRD